MRWAFIDYENVGNLGKIELSSYQRIIIFLGSKQEKLDFGGKKYASPLDISVVQVNATQPNNLDFHLSFYLGKYNSEAPPDTEFEVITNDNGFAPLISHIKHNGRKCKQIRLQNISTNQSKLVTTLTSSPKEKRPKKVANLKNYIASMLKIQGNEIAIQNHLNQLVNGRIIAISDEAVEYKC